MVLRLYKSYGMPVRLTRDHLNAMVIVWESTMQCYPCRALCCNAAKCVNGNMSARYIAPCRCQQIPCYTPHQSSCWQELCILAEDRVHLRLYHDICNQQCCAVLCSAVLYAVLCCAVLCCAMLCCAVLCSAVQCCAVLCYAVLCT